MEAPATVGTLSGTVGECRRHRQRQPRRTEQARVRRPELAEATAALARNPEVRRPMQQDPGAPPPPVLLLRYRFDDARLTLFLVIASLQAPLNPRVEDLRVELFIPADDETADWFRRG